MVEQPAPRRVEPAFARALASRAWLPAVTLVGLAVRLALVAVGRGELRFFDEHDYDAIARALVSGGGYSLDGHASAWRPPGQVGLIAVVYAVVGARPLWVEVAQSILLCALPWAIAKLTRRVSQDRFAPPIAAALASLHPGLAYGAATLYPATLTALGLTLGIWLVVETAERRTTAHALGAGTALGVAALATPYFAPLPLVAAFLLGRRAAKGALVVALAGLLPIAAWAVRNQVVMGTAKTATNAGYNLALGANDRATPRSGNWIEPDPIDPRVREDEVERDAVWSADAREWIARNPGRWSMLAAGRVIAIVDSVGQARTRGAHDSLAGRGAGWLLLPWVLLGLVGLVLERRSLAARLTLAAVLLIAVSAALTIVKPRFRFPIDPALATFAVVAVSTGLRRLRATGRSVLGAEREPGAAQADADSPKRPAS